MANINPLMVSESLKETYGRYLQSLLRPSDARFADEIARVIAENKSGEAGLLKGPFLEAQPPYVKDISIRQLVDEGVLNEGFLDFGPEAFPIDRTLYSHQVRSIRRVTQGKSVIVATGTGSGKTESFLLPIINELLHQRSQNKLGAGVRALLLYPMNALANDQVKRLRQILSATPQITFGRYTGETPNSYEEALAKYRADFGEEPLPNELISREQMQATPPNILLTNFAMLEYLLLRPKDSSLFDGPSGRTWRFIVADEAHTYDGAHGVEVANLISKLRERVDPDRIVQTIGTTATIGKDKDEIREFAESFFGNAFEIGLESAPDLIEPIRLEIPEATWGPISPADWRAIELYEKSLSDVAGNTAASEFELCQSEFTVTALRNLLMGGPSQFQAAAEEVFPEADLEEARSGLLALLNVCARSTNLDGEPAVSARFHLFARATEGIFSCLSSDPHMTLSRHVDCPECEGKSFELGACRKCGGTYFLSSLNEGGGYRFLTQNKGNLDPNPIALYPSRLAMDSDDADLDIKDSDLSVEEQSDDTIHVCRKCGYLEPIPFAVCPKCDNAEIGEWVAKRGSADEINKCPQCNSVAPNIIRRLASGSDAAAAVLATELYTHLPEDADGYELGKPGGGRKLMVFSDSRQQAAFFAPYLEATHERILWRQVILRGLQERDKTKLPGHALRVADIESHVIGLARNGHLLPAKVGANQAQKLAIERLHWEAVSTDRQMNLDGTGLVSWQMALPENEASYTGLLRLGFDLDESKTLLQQLLTTLREGGMLTHSTVLESDGSDLFAPRRGPLYIRGAGAEPSKKIHAWAPDVLSGSQNSRSDYLSKVFARKGIQGEENVAEVLNKIWALLTGPTFADVLVRTNHTTGPVWRLNHELLEIHLVDDSTQLWACDICGRTTRFNVAGVCGRFRCKGTLEITTADAPIFNQHYRALYAETPPVGLIAHEHTAQLSSDTASQVQQAFIEGDINVLSSSTTFELGVDVGELQAVLLRNMPPSTANYLQRAGRAGRRSDSAALILTYAQRRPHDLAQYANPVKMIAGEMRAPYVNLENARIFTRHMYSVFFASYWRVRPDNFTKAGSLFLKQGDDEGAVIDEIVSWVQANRSALREKFDWLLPKRLQSNADVIWNSILATFEILSKSVTAAFQAEIEEYDRLINFHHEEAHKNVEKRRSHEITRDRLEKARKALAERDILGFLSSKNLLPKYGFPVDTVNLLPRLTDVGAQEIDMSRDLTLAIFEYAPGNQLVANGQLWDSVGLEVQPGKELERFNYAICGNCKHLHKQLADLPGFPRKCATCDEGLVEPHVFMNPKWGFVANASTQKVGESLKSRSWRRNVVLSDAGQLDDETTISTPGTRVLANLQNIARVLVLNEAEYSVCESCHYAEATRSGRGSPKKRGHPRPKQQSDKKCEGYMTNGLRFGHEYETDLVKIEVDLTGSGLDPKAVSDSTQYALVQAAADLLQIAQGDLDVVTANRTSTTFSFAIVDAVPAGAGFAKLVAKNLGAIFERALTLVSDCECGEETSCYECLRNYSNQRLHDDLARGLAKQALEWLMEKPGAGRAI
jgi:ATP-dependent helicase YprA (DUF1998 family)